MGDKKKVVVFIDTFRSKNQLQYDCIEKMDMDSIWFTTDKSSQQYDFCSYLKRGTIARFKQVYNYFSEEKNNIHHIEIYPGGKFSVIYVLLAKWFNIKIICAERGDLLYYKPRNNGGYDFLTRLSMKYTYKWSNLVWYREHYMLAILKRIGVKKIVCIPNAVKQNAKSNTRLKDIDFLWVNRIIPERKAQWFVDNLTDDTFLKSKNVLIGLLNNGGKYRKLENQLKDVNSTNIEFLPFMDPIDYYTRAKFFVLPAEVIFANNSLLEAMTHGVVPLISYTEDSSKIVTDGIDGFIFEHNPEAFLACMKKVMTLSDEDYLKMSVAAKNKITKDFSEETYYQQLEKMYVEL